MMTSPKSDNAVKIYSQAKGDNCILYLIAYSNDLNINHKKESAVVTTEGIKAQKDFFVIMGTKRKAIDIININANITPETPSSYIV